MKMSFAFILSHGLAHVLAGHCRELYNRKSPEKGYGFPYAPFGLCGGLCALVGLVATDLAMFAGSLLLLPYGVGHMLQNARFREHEDDAGLIGLS